jgi:acetyl/propionyl-CoA carboxylase alpha subunit
MTRFGMTRFSRIAIVNRGEAAMRLIRAAREVEVEQGSPLTTFALYTDAERNAMFVREADVAVRIYSAERDPYLDYDVLERALRDSGADAVWVGWGFVSEDPEFADRVEKMGLVFIGPSGQVIASWATRSAPSTWPSGPAYRSPRGAAARSLTWRRLTATPGPSGTR